MKVIKDLGIETTKSGYRKRFVLAKCKCGTVKKVALNSIKTGNTKTCGKTKCVSKPNALSRQPEYSLYNTIKTRCYNKNRESWRWYKGITMCDDWLNNPQKFIDWCRANGYKKGLYIDRIDVKKEYSPDNCRFVNAKINARNTRRLCSVNKSGYRGVTKHKRKDGSIGWRARIGLNGRNISLGVYKNKIDAAKAYDSYVIENNTGHTVNGVL